MLHFVNKLGKKFTQCSTFLLVGEHLLLFGAEHLLGLRNRHLLHVAAVLVDRGGGGLLLLPRRRRRPASAVQLDRRVPEAALLVAEVAARDRGVEVDLILEPGIARL